MSVLRRPSRSISGFAGRPAHNPLLPVRIGTSKIRKPIGNSTVAKPRSGPLRNGCQLISRTRAGAGRSPKPTATAALGAVIADRLAGKSRRYFRIVAELIRRRSHAPVRRFLVHAG